jgi:hypothetical protein
MQVKDRKSIVHGLCVSIVEGDRDERAGEPYM